MLYPRYFVRFLDGRNGNVATIAFLPLDIGAYMPTLSPHVLVERDYALKLQGKHRLRYEQFQLIQTVIDKGYCIKHKANHLEFMYGELLTGKCYNLVLKSANGGDETWLVTFYRCKQAQIRSHLKRGDLIRAHARD